MKVGETIDAATVAGYATSRMAKEWQSPPIMMDILYVSRLNITIAKICTTRTENKIVNRKFEAYDYLGVLGMVMNAEQQ